MFVRNLKCLLAALLTVCSVFAQRTAVRKAIVYLDGKITTLGDEKEQKLNNYKDQFWNITPKPEGLLMEALSKKVTNNDMSILPSGRSSMDLYKIDDCVFSLALQPVKLDKDQYYGILLEAIASEGRSVKYKLLINKQGDCKLLLSTDRWKTTTTVFELKNNDWVKDGKNYFRFQKFGNYWKFSLNDKQIHETGDHAGYTFGGVVPKTVIDGAGKLMVTQFYFTFHGNPAQKTEQLAQQKPEPDPEMNFTSVADALEFIKRKAECGVGQNYSKMENDFRKSQSITYAHFEFQPAGDNYDIRYRYAIQSDTRVPLSDVPADSLAALGSVMEHEVRFKISDVTFANPTEPGEIPGIRLKMLFRIEVNEKRHEYEEMGNGRRVTKNHTEASLNPGQFVFFCRDEATAKKLVLAFLFAGTQTLEKLWDKK